MECFPESEMAEEYRKLRKQSLNCQRQEGSCENAMKVTAIKDLEGGIKS